MCIFCFGVILTPNHHLRFYSFSFLFLLGPPTPTSVNVSMAMNSSIAGLLVSWNVAQEVYGFIQYHVISDQNLTCKSTSSSCTLWAVRCGETHTMQVIALNEAGPSQPSSPLFFVTCECKRYLGISEL